MKPYLFVVALLLLLPFVGAYDVGVPLTVNLHVQYDNGSSLVDVVTQSCVADVYDASTSSLVVRSLNMTPGLLHNITFTPADVGGYTVSMKCSFNNESAVFFQSLSVTTPGGVSGGGGGGGGSVINLQARIIPSNSSFLVNQQAESRLSFFTSYESGGALVNAETSEWRLLDSNGVVKDQGNFIITGLGTYEFSYDFKDYAPGDYRVSLFFDGQTVFVAVHVISQNPSLAGWTGWLYNSDGSLNTFAAVVAVCVVVVLAMMFTMLVLRWRRSMKARRAVRQGVARRGY